MQRGAINPRARCVARPGRIVASAVWRASAGRWECCEAVLHAVCGCWFIFIHGILNFQPLFVCMSVPCKLRLSHRRRGQLSDGLTSQKKKKKSNLIVQLTNTLK